jgi:hypothetical protein
MLEQPGLLVWNAQNLPGFLPDEMHAGGFRWIALDLHDGLELVEKTDYRALIAQYRARGLEVAGWGVLRTQPKEEAELAVELCARYDIHTYIADAEREYGYTQEIGPCGECFERSDRWVEAFRAHTDMELGFSSYSIFAQHDAHYVPWIEAGAAAMPQTYTNEFTWATPEAGVAGALDLRQPHNPPNGWPRGRIFPTIGNYEAASVHLPQAQEYAELLRQARVASFSIYLGELVREGELAAYAGVCVDHAELASPPPALPPLAEDEVPYTGPYSGPGGAKMIGPTAKALKIALERMGVASFPDPDETYSLELEQAMRTWQRTVGVRPTGEYGRASYEALRAAVTPSGEHALDARAIALLRSDAVRDA